MRRDFDQMKDKDISFVVGGEEFKIEYVHPDILAGWEEQPRAATSAEALKEIDKRIKMFLGENGDAARWDKLRKRKKDPVTLAQMSALLTWLIEVNSDLPTSTPSPSASGRGTTATTSTAG